MMSLPVMAPDSTLVGWHLLYVQQAGSTHSTGMLSCLYFNLTLLLSDLSSLHTFVE